MSIETLLLKLLIGFCIINVPTEVKYYFAFCFAIKVMKLVLFLGFVFFFVIRNTPSTESLMFWCGIFSLFNCLVRAVDLE